MNKLIKVSYKLLDFIVDSEYRIGTDGSVWSKKRSSFWRRMKTTKSKDGYFYIMLRKNGGSYCSAVHRLVLLAFVGPCPEGMECRHLDNNPQNNCLDNLCWGTHEEQYQDRVKYKTDNQGERNGKSKLTENQAKKLIELASTGTYTRVELGAKFRISEKTAAGVINGTVWSHLHRPKDLLSLCKIGKGGENNNTSVLTEKQVLKIRKLRQETNTSLSKLSELYGISKSAMWGIVSGQTWKHLI